MKFTLLDGSTTKISINPNEYLFRPQELCSKIEWATGQYLKKRFPFDVCLAQWQIPGTQLRADFYLPTRRLMIESDGAFHQEYTEFFHSNKLGFQKSKQRDSSKELWCKLNSIKLVRITNEQELASI